MNIDGTVTVGDKYPVDILNMWCIEGYNRFNSDKRTWVKSKGFQNTPPLRQVVERAIKDGVTVFGLRNESNHNIIIWLKEEGFIEFLKERVGENDYPKPEKGKPMKSESKFISPIEEGKEYKIWADGTETFRKVYDRLLELGHPDNPVVRADKYPGIYIYKSGILARSNNHKFFCSDSPQYIELSVSDLWPKEQFKENKQLNNNQITTKTDGKVIIVPRKVATIRRGETFTGNRVSSKTSWSTVAVGYISNRAISGGKQAALGQSNQLDEF